MLFLSSMHSTSHFMSVMESYPKRWCPTSTWCTAISFSYKLITFPTGLILMHIPFTQKIGQFSAWAKGKFLILFVKRVTHQISKQVLKVGHATLSQSKMFQCLMVHNLMLGCISVVSTILVIQFKIRIISQLSFLK